jgi:hypothetical protein
MGAANTLPCSLTPPSWILESVIDVLLKIGLTTDYPSLETYCIIFGLGQVYDHDHISPGRHFLIEIVYCEKRFG